MKKNAVVFLLLIVVASCSQKKLKFDNYIATIKDFQYEMNVEFANEEESPLTEEGIKDLIDNWKN